MPPTLVLIEGFENGVATPSANGGGLVNTISGTLSVQSSIKRTGSYALRINVSSATAYGIWNVSFGSVAVASVYIYFSTLPTVNNTYVFRFDSAGDVPILYWNTTENTLAVGINGVSGYQAANISFSTGQWYRFDIRVDWSTTTHTIEWKIDGADQTTYSATGRTASQTLTGVRLGMSSGTMDAYYDDLRCSATSGDYPIGAGGVVAIVPTIDVSSLTGSVLYTHLDGTNNFWGTLDEIPMSETTTYIKQTGTGASNYVRMGFGDTAQTIIHGATAMLAYRSSATQANQGACFVTDEDATETEVWGNATTRADYSESSMFYKRSILPNPAGGWDQAAVNALEVTVGHSGDASPNPYWSNFLIEVAYGEATGTTYPQALAGTIGTITGSLGKQTNKATAGSMTPAGAVVKQTAKSLTGTIATITGALRKQTAKTLTGAVATITGALAGIKAATRTFTGAITPTGTAQKQTNKTVTGSLTPAGAAQKQTAKQVTGSIATSGLLTGIKAVVRAFAGSASSSGILSKQLNKPLAGTVTAAGAVIKQTAKHLAGSISSSGAAAGIKALVRSFAGSISSGGSLGKQANKPVAGSVATSGSVARQTAKRLLGTISSAGAVAGIKALVRSFAGSIGSSGAIGKQANKQTAGSVTTAGTVQKQTSKRLLGSVTPAGALARLKAALMTFTGSLAPSGSLTKSLGFSFAGTIASVGVALKQAQLTFTGSVSFAGVLASEIIAAVDAAARRRRHHPVADPDRNDSKGIYPWYDRVRGRR